MMKILLDLYHFSYKYNILNIIYNVKKNFKRINLKFSTIIQFYFIYFRKNSMEEIGK